MNYQFLEVQLSVAEFKVASTTRIGALQRRGHLKRQRVVVIDGVTSCGAAVAGFILQ